MLLSTGNAMQCNFYQIDWRNFPGGCIFCSWLKDNGKILSIKISSKNYEKEKYPILQGIWKCQIFSMQAKYAFLCNLREN